MADLPLAPGQPYIEVDYDYEYKSKDRLISIHQGECYLLVKKTNEDWWQVRRDDGSKAFYVPAQYVREVRKALMPPQPPSKPEKPAHVPLMPPEKTVLASDKAVLPAERTVPSHGPGAAEADPSAPASARVKPSSLELPAGGTDALSRGESNLRRSPGNKGDSPLHSPLRPHSDRDRLSSSSTLPRSRGRSPELQREPLDVDCRLGNDSGDEPRTNESESELSSSSTEMLQNLSSLGHSGSDSSVHTNLQELKLSGSSVGPLSSCGDWDSHRDPSGRLFYVNRVTQERSWKPPRGREQGAGPGGEKAGPGGEWLKTADDQGRHYFNSADGSRSEWELPKLQLNHSPPHLTVEGVKTRSLDRRSVEPIVLTKWRHSTHLPEPPEKDSVAGLWVEPGPESPSSPKSPSSPSEKCGVLNMTKITENGKKVRKNWTSSWTVLQGSTLLFTKGQTGGSSWFGGQSKPELTVDLRGASVDWAPKDRSSKKHVLELKTRPGTELLIQSDNEAVVQDWLQALQDAITAHAWESDEGLEDDLESPEQDDRNERDKEHRDSRKERVVKSSSSLDVSENKKTRHRLKRFLTRRPTLQAVRDKGYIKDQVFGCSLSSLCHRENSTVPIFVKMCIEHVETNGLSIDGLYRVSGNLAVIQKLRYAVNHDERVTLSDSKWEDIHVTTGALKMFFRELPEPLFPFNLFHDFVSAIKSPDYRQRVQSIKDLIRQLPKANHDTMQALFRHLCRVVDHGDDNRMTIQSVAIVFGPTLLRPETETWNMAVHMVYQNQIVELILIECESIFGR